MRTLTPLAFLLVGCSANPAQDRTNSSSPTATATAPTRPAYSASTPPGAVDGHTPYAQRGEK